MARWLELVSLDELLRRPALRNPKNHIPEEIASSIDRHGFVENPAIDERTGRLVAGHGRLDALVARRASGEQPPDGVEVSDNGDWLVPVQRGWASASDSAAEAYVIASNALTINGGWEEDILAEMLKDYADDPDWLTGTGYDEKQVVSFLASLKGDDEQELLGDPDEVPEPPAAPVSRRGDVWLLRHHRLMCGDVTNKSDIDTLIAGTEIAAVISDPPYGVGEKCDRGSRRRGMDPRGVGNPGPWAEAHDFPDVEGDDEPFDPAPVLAIAPRSNMILFGANYFAERLPPSAAWIVWDKLGGLITEKRDVGFNDNADVELAWSNLGGPARLFSHRWTGLMKASEHGQARVHPTQKPVALFVWCIERATEQGDVVLDPYAGSGASLLAAHQTGRIAYAMDIVPAYVDVICRRFQAATGIVPVLEATGKPHDFSL